MRILGLHNGHDASITAMENGEILYHWELERHYELKHFTGYLNPNSIVYFLEKHALPILNWDCADVICFATITGNLGQWQTTDFRKIVTSGRNNQPFYEWSATWRGKEQKFFRANHHINHLATSYYTSPFNSALVFAYDGEGEHGINTAIGLGDGNKICHSFEVEPNSIVYYNKLPLQLAVGDCSEFPSDRIKQLADHYEIFLPTTTHGAVLSGIYHYSAISDYFLTIDSDVEFVAYGVIADLMKKLADPSLFAVSVDRSCEFLRDYPQSTISWDGKVIRKQTSFVHQARPQPHLCLWRNDEQTQRVIKAIGFETAWQHCPEQSGKLWDTGALAAVVLGLSGRDCAVVDTTGFIHYGSVSTSKNKYQRLEPLLRSRLFAYSRLL